MVNLLCVASTHDGVLPPVADLAFLLRPMGEDKVEALLAELHLKGLLDPVEAPGGAISYAPCRWSERQYRSDVTDPTAAARMQRTGTASVTRVTVKTVTNVTVTDL